MNDEPGCSPSNGGSARPVPPADLPNSIVVGPRFVLRQQLARYTFELV